MKFILTISLLFILHTMSAQLQPVQSKVYHWEELPTKKGKDRESRKILEGTSPHLDYLEIHATTQYAGAAPSNAHANEDIEELIIVKQGTLEVTVAGKSTVLGAGGIMNLMPKNMHSMVNVGNDNVTYYVIRYRSKKPMNLERGVTSGGTLLLNRDSLTYVTKPRGGGISYFDRSTSMCERLEMHITELNLKGPSHNPHSHIETEIVLVISGDTEVTIGDQDFKGTVGDLYFIESQLFHGIRNATDNTCSYFALKWK
ncbi:MAG: cupin domain-containing protein [Bacteroidota bacterium]